MDPVLNERSLEPSEVPIGERVTSLIGVLRKLDALGFPRVLRHARDTVDREVATGISLRMWLLQRAPREVRHFMGGRLEKAPFVEDLHRQKEDARRSLLQASYEGAPAIGAGTAYLHDAPAIALCGVSRWEVDPLVILLTKLDEEGGTLVEMPVEVVHLCRSEQVDPREKLLRERVLHAVSGGDELWQRRLELFPQLDFCPGVERQVRALSGKEFYFQHVVLALSRLDKSLAEWTLGALHPGMDHSTESQATLAHGRYGTMRDFVCPDQQTRRFKNHLKLFSNNWRIYYLEGRSGDAGGRAFVGYVGAHLPTVMYPT